MRNRHSRGFTLVEILAVTALLVILLGIASVGVARYVRLLKIVELDNAAREIYLAAENRAVLLDNGGQLKDAVGVKDDATNKFVVGTETVALDGTTEDIDLYYISSSDSSRDKLVPVGSIDPTLRERYYYIVYEPVSGCVTDVFYGEGDISALLTSFGGEFKGFYDTYIKASRKERMELTPMLGYYGGGMAERAPVELLKTPKVRVIIHNEERLWVEVIFEVDKEADTDDVVKKVRLTYGGEEVDLRDTAAMKDRITEPSGPDEDGEYKKYVYTWVLDELVNEEIGKEERTFLGLVPGAALGGDFTVTATVSSSSGKFSTESASDTDNTLFDEESTENTARIKYLRHLQNLNKDSGFAVGSGKNQAIQTETIRCRTNSTYKDYTFIPIENDFLISYNGGKKEIRDLYIKDAGRASGLFSMSPAGASYTDVRLVNAEVRANGDIKLLAAGALIGETKEEVSIDGCWVYWDTAEKPNLRDVLGSNEEGSSYNYKITGDTAGGLVGRMWGGTISNSFAATTVEAYITGGLIGESYGAVKITHSYTDCYLAAKAGNEGALGVKAAGLIGNLENGSTLTLNSCYAAGFIDMTNAEKAAGLCLGNGETISKSVYTVVRPYRNSDGKFFYDLTERVNRDEWQTKSVPAGQNEQTNFYLGNEKTDKKAYSYSQMVTQTGTKSFISDLGSSDFEWKKSETQRSENHPYNLRKDLTLTIYSYPGLKNLPHYGDWTEEPANPFLVYYEAYEDGTYGFWGINGQQEISTLVDDKLVQKDGYAIAFLETDLGKESNAYILYNSIGTANTWESNGGKKYDEARLYKSTFINQEQEKIDYRLAPLPDEYVIKNEAPDNFFSYLKFELKIATTVVEGHSLYNPHFAATARSMELSSGETLTDEELKEYLKENLLGEPEVVRVRTPRHLWDLSRFSAYQNKGYRFRQELDLDYKEYTGYSLFDSNGTNKQAPIGDQTIPFNGEYDGECHTIEGVAFQVPEGGQLSCAGLFGVSEGQLKNVVYKMEADVVPHRVALSGATNLYIGGLVGVNRSTVYNCAVEGVNVVAASSGSALYAGGLAGRNEGIIKNCGAEATRLAVDCSQYSKAYLGGLVGENAQGDSIASSYAVGRISAVVDGTSEAVLCGFAGTNQGTINNSYAAVDLRADGVGAATTAKMTKYGFSDNKGQTYGCYYLNNGNFTYREETYAALYKDESGATGVSYDWLTQNNSTFGMGKATNNKFPYPTGVKNGKGENVHYGKWPEPIELGSFGVYYWEKMVFNGDEENAGYYVSLLAVDTKNRTVEKKSTLLTDHNDGGVVTEWGYGYYYPLGKNYEVVSNKEAVNLEDYCPPVCGIYNLSGENGLTKTEETFAVSESANIALNKLMPEFHYKSYVSYDPHRNRDGIIPESPSLLAPDIPNSYIVLKGEGKFYPFWINPHFADAIAIDNNPFWKFYSDWFGNSEYGWQSQSPWKIDSKLCISPGTTPENPYEVRSVAQMEFINWDKEDHVITNTIKSNAYDNSYLAGMNYNNEPFWVQSHDLDGRGEIYSPIAEPCFNDLYGWFAGSYDGQNYVIDNVNVKGHDNASAAGLFGAVYQGELKNIVLYSSDGSNTVEGVGSAKTESQWYGIGALAGLVADSEVTNCSVAGYTVKTAPYTRSSYYWENPQGSIGVGGLIGIFAGDGEKQLAKCTAVATVEVLEKNENFEKIGKPYEVNDNLHVGGLTGVCQGTIQNCYAGGEIQAIPDKLTFANGKGAYVGGLAGGSYMKPLQADWAKIGKDKNIDNTFDSCYTYVKLPSQENVAKMYAIGGLGEIEKNGSCTINNCYYLDSVAADTSNLDDVKGKVGKNAYPWEVDYRKLAGEIPVATNDAGEVKSIYQLLKDFAPVTTKTEDGLSVRGKYSFPPKSESELKGMDYPFPTVLIRENQNVHVHYGAWPVQGIVRQASDGPDKYLGSKPIELGLFTGGVHTETLVLMGVSVPEGAKVTWGYPSDMENMEIEITPTTGKEATLKVTGKKIGTATFTVTCTVENMSYTREIEVNVASGLTLKTDPETVTMFPGDTVTVPLKVNNDLPGDRTLTASGGYGVSGVVETTQEGTAYSSTLHLTSGSEARFAETALVNVSGSYEGHQVSGVVIVTKKKLPELVAVEGKKDTYTLTFEGATGLNVEKPENSTVEVKVDEKKGVITLSGLNDGITLKVKLTMGGVDHTVTMTVKPEEKPPETTEP